jgi:hypothetical protein
MENSVPKETSSFQLTNFVFAELKREAFRRSRNPVTRYFPVQTLAEQPGDLGRFGAAAHAAQKLLGEAKAIVLAHGLLMA